jgi:multisubunit Na+/H+ antiporter MnhG subunit
MGGILWLIGIIIAAAIIMYGMAKGLSLVILVGFILLPVITLSVIKAFARTGGNEHHAH